MHYEIEGGSLPVVVCHLEAGETIISDKGSMSWMSSNMKMETFSEGVGKALGRMLSGEAAFLNKFTAQDKAGFIAFASSFPGSIYVAEITPDKPILAQKHCYMASEPGVSLEAHVLDDTSSGLFGGEGFIMQRLSGQGLAFLEVDGHAMAYELAEGEQLIVDTGYLAAMDQSVTMDVVKVSGMKNKFLGGEGLFNTRFTGPGRVVLQSMPLERLGTSE